MSWEDIIKINDSQISTTIGQLVEDAKLLKIAIDAGIESVYEERFKNVMMAFADVESDFSKFRERLQ